MHILKSKEGNFRIFEFDSRVGLNAKSLMWKYPCVMTFSDSKFFVWLGDVPIDKFTKSTFLNLATFAEQNKSS